jgi:signal peptidase I
MRFVDRAQSRLPQPWRAVLDWAVTIVAAVAFVLAFEAEVAKPFRIPSSSMEQTLHCARPGSGCRGSVDDRVVANRLAYVFGEPKRGQIVVFNAPDAALVKCRPAEGRVFVKRLIGLPGETVRERAGHVSIDGHPLVEPYVDRTLRDPTSGTWRVPAGRYFFLGDNRADSCDSRFWGAVPRSSLIGPVALTYWPPNRLALH